MRRTLRAFAGDLEFADRPLLLAVGIMLCTGLIVVYGAGSYYRLGQNGLLEQHRELLRHVGMALTGLGVMFAAMRLDYRWWRQPWVYIGLLVITLAMTGAVLFTEPMTRGGEVLPRRWLKFGSIGVQPAELAKIAVMMYLAAIFGGLRKGERLSWKRLLLVLAAGPGVLALLLLKQPNFGNVLVLCLMVASVMLVTRVADRWLLWLMAAAPFVSMLGFLLSSKVHDRVVGLWNGWTRGVFEDQQRQSLISMAANGLGGAGMGQGHNKYLFLHEAHSDFIFASLSEDWGAVGALLIIGALVLLVWRGYGIAARTNDPFGRALATGLTTGLAAYGLINVAMVTGLMPVIGVPLPLVSAGGTSLVVTLGAIGILLNIERTSRSYAVWRRRWQRGGAA